MQTPRGTFEIYQGRGQVVRRVAGVGCQAAARDPVRIPFLRDPEDPPPTETYTLSRKADDLIEGTPVHVYGVVTEVPSPPYPITL